MSAAAAAAAAVVARMCVQAACVQEVFLQDGRLVVVQESYSAFKSVMVTAP
jgi:hypothetical protein